MRKRFNTSVRKVVPLLQIKLIHCQNNKITKWRHTIRVKREAANRETSISFP